MRNPRLLALASVCIVIGFILIIVIGLCDGKSISCSNTIYIVLGFLLILLGLCSTILFCIILWKSCGALLKRIKSSSHSSISMVENFLREMPFPTRYSHSQLKKIANNFAEKLGKGGYGVVYKGKLHNGIPVTVKILDRNRHNEDQFMNEVATIGHVHHVNLVCLLGYCFESFTSALVYEDIPNGSLDNFTFDGKEKAWVLRWEQLYSIALGVARGIAYLHQDCDKLIVHFDIKPHNILLDVEFAPKNLDFGLEKLCGKGDNHISMTTGRGTQSYVYPEMCHSDAGPFTDKTNVYSFKMLLLEIVGRRKNLDLQLNRSSQFYFPEWVFKLLENGELGMILRGGGEKKYEEKTVRLMTKVGLWCIQYNSRDWPGMGSVVLMLEGNGDNVANPPLPFNNPPTAPEIPMLSNIEESPSIRLYYSNIFVRYC